MDNYIFDLDENVSRTPVSYKNRYGITIAADLYRPKDFDESRQYPAVLIGPPYSGVKEQGPGVYAQNLAKRGFVALAFDPSFNGYSGGEPRHASSPDIFVEDFSAAVDYLGTRDFVDRERIGVIGICGSGSFALGAAQADRRIKAVAATSMVDISWAAANLGPTGPLTDEQRAEVLDSLGEQRYTDFLEGQPALGPRGAAIGFDENTEPIAREFGEFYSTPRGYHPNSITQFTRTSDMAFMNFTMLDRLKWISPRPILLIVGEQAFSRFFSDNVYKEASEPKELHVVPDANHIDLYDRTDRIPFDKLEEFFTKNLA
ncbi:alpha/beta hydrolase [Streptomyces sp. NPDC101234]|uniref:alpha/beta hydrolase n=1 Tax=Streptomyces sp. NPDC101234 TaxID=3366138 RepID=UPI003822AFB8